MWLRFDATTLWHFDAAEWAPSTTSKADMCGAKADVRFVPIATNALQQFFS